MSKISLRLFIAGRTSRSERAIANLRRICEQELEDYQCELVVIDVLADPQQAEIEKILATPTLIKDEPLPRRRVIGDLSNIADVLTALNLPPYIEGDLVR